ncbi:hypothetical protein [Williamsia sp. CHRR-6]|uniref:hypothetical protein n=1 Tax=Williamsia sp. CHRR-6 TaxID=2835871 RepID=UPI001BDB2298|nr:hypothetical protein [Williamsia sp. CHRR-6]MBT0568571.1 hypothetical protein [Williamsia sp. CHRR-6]
MSNLEVEIAGLREAGRKFLQAADDVAASQAKISAEVDGRDSSVWGGDEPGGVFGDGYSKAHAEAMATLADIKARLYAAAAGVGKSASRLEAQEDEIAARVASEGGR